MVIKACVSMRTVPKARLFGWTASPELRYLTGDTSVNDVCTPPLPSDDHSMECMPPRATQAFVHDIDVVKFTVLDAQHGSVSDAARRDRAEVGAVHCRGRRCRCGPNEFAETDTEAKEFRHDRQHLECGAVYAQRVDIAAQYIGHESCVENRVCGFKCETAGSVAKIKYDATPTRLGDLLPHFAARPDRRFGEWPEAMCDGVAGAKASHDGSVAKFSLERILQQYSSMNSVLYHFARITEVMHEVSRTTGFTAAFTNLRTGERCDSENTLLATILADASNLGLARVAAASQGVTRDR
jgi:hypothetical protein